MAYTSSKLNNIGSSTGRSILWFYSADGTLAAATSDNFFNDAQEQGMRDRDLIIVSGSTGAGLYRLDYVSGAMVLTDILPKP